MRPLVGVSTQGPCVASGGFYVLYDETAEANSIITKEEEDDKYK